VTVGPLFLLCGAKYELDTGQWTASSHFSLLEENWREIPCVGMKCSVDHSDPCRPRSSPAVAKLRSVNIDMTCPFAIAAAVRLTFPR
jgi:hypothetical protein